MMDVERFYHAIGGDYREVLKRIPCEEIIVKSILDFRGDPSYKELQKARAAQNVTAAFSAAHALKGVTAVLGMGDLSVAVAALSDWMWRRKEMAPEAMFCAVDEAYRRTIEAINAMPA